MFDGGVASRQEPQLLNINQGVVYTNIDVSKGSLTPLKDKVATVITLTAYHKFYEYGQEWISSPTPKYYLEFQRKMYIADGVDYPQKYSAGVYNKLGIARPVGVLTLVNASKAPQLESATLTEATDSGDLYNGGLDYLLFNVKDNVLGTPIELNVAKVGIKLSVSTSTGAFARALNKHINLSLLPPSTRRISFTGVLGNLADRAELYRRYDGNWRFLHSFTSSTDSFSDSVYDISANAELDLDDVTSFSGTYTYVYTYYNATEGVESAPSSVSEEIEANSGSMLVTGIVASTDPQVTNIRLYRVGNNLTQFALVEELLNVTTSYTDTLKDSDIDGRLLATDNYYDAPSGLKFLSESYAMLFGVIGSKLYFTPVGVPDAWPPEYFLQFDSELTGYGAVSNGILVFTKYKTYIVTGTGPTTLSQQLLRGDQGCIAFESIQKADIGTLIWASADGLCSSSGNNVISLTKATIGDLSLTPVSSVVHNEVYYCHNEDGTTLAWDYRFAPIPKWLDLGVESLTLANNILYGYSDGRLHEMFKSTSYLSMTYLSPRFVEGAITQIKIYKKIYIRSKGDIILDTIIDNNVVSTLTLNSEDTHQLLVPHEKHRGYSIQFNVTGTGAVQEIEYTATGRQND